MPTGAKANNKKGSFGALRVKAKAKSGRGQIDPGAVVEAMIDEENWKALRDAIERLPEEEQDALRDHFNEFLDEQDDLGDILFGDNDDFDSRIKFLDDDQTKKYVDELINMEVIDKDEIGL